MAVILALVIRELRTRVQGRWLALSWMVLEPLAHILLILTLFQLRRHSTVAGVEFPVFLAIGLLPFFTFRNVARRLPGAVAANRGLFAYRQVKPMDALLGKAIVEVALYGVVYISTLAVLGWLGFEWLPRAPLELFATATILVTFAFGLGLIFTVAANNRPKVNTIIGMFFLPLYITSGVIIPLHSLPSEVQRWLMFNPVAHLIDLARSQFLDGYRALDGANLAYPAAWALAALALGMNLYRVYRHHLLTST